MSTYTVYSLWRTLYYPYSIYSSRAIQENNNLSNTKLLAYHDVFLKFCTCSDAIQITMLVT